MSLIPLPARCLLLAALVAASGLYGWTSGATHAERRLEDYVRAVESAADRQQVRVRLIESRQRAVTKEVQHETVDRIARSDEYYRLRWPAGNPGRLPSVSDATGPTDGTSKAGAFDPAGCNPADGAADAIVILAWQEWWRKMEAGQSLGKPRDAEGG